MALFFLLCEITANDVHNICRCYIHRNTHTEKKKQFFAKSANPFVCQHIKYAFPIYLVISVIPLLLLSFFPVRIFVRTIMRILPFFVDNSKKASVQQTADKFSRYYSIWKLMEMTTATLPMHLMTDYSNKRFHSCKIELRKKIHKSIASLA